LSGAANDVLSGMVFAIEQMLTNIIQSRTVADYEAAYGQYFSKYVQIMLALSRFADAMIPADVMQRLTWESFCERESDLRQDGDRIFGTAIKDQALFTVWTMRKISDLLGQIRAAKLTERSAEDKECSQQYVLNTLRAGFSLDCLGMALRTKGSIYPDVQAEITDGLRAAVNAYAWVRRGLNLRVPTEEQVVPEIQWDEEDEELLSSSMADFVHEEY
jgi:hypothetical protein